MIIIIIIMTIIIVLRLYASGWFVTQQWLSHSHTEISIAPDYSLLNCYFGAAFLCGKKLSLEVKDFGFKSC
jgi:hypothetical protein